MSTRIKKWHALRRKRAVKVFPDEEKLKLKTYAKLRLENLTAQIVIKQKISIGVANLLEKRIDDFINTADSD